MQKGFSSILLLLGLPLVVVIGGGLFYLGRLTAPPAPEAATLSQSPSSIPTQTMVPAQSPQLKSTMKDETTSWKTYTDTRYSFQYPTDWIVSNDSYLNSVSVKNPQGTVSIGIFEGQYPYSISPGVRYETRDVNISISGEEYSATEAVVGDDSVYVNLTAQGYNILFGTGYPGSSGKGNPQEYYTLKPTLLQILSSLKFN